MSDQMDPLDRLVEGVLTSPKYRHVSETFVRNVGARELAHRHNLKEAIKATKNKLHQVGGAYLGHRLDYRRWLADLNEAAASGDGLVLSNACSRIMRHHSATRERLEILDEFYATTLGHLPPIHRVVDVACGLNPLAIPWMPLAPDAEYFAYEIYADMAEFLNDALPLLGVRGYAHVCDAVQECPTETVDLALLLKTLPCVEQVDKAAGLRLMEELDANHLLVSFPVQSLGGRDRQMVANYEARFRELVAAKSWKVQRFEFATELAFLVAK